ASMLSGARARNGTSDYTRDFLTARVLQTFLYVQGEQPAFTLPGIRVTGEVALWRRFSTCRSRPDIPVPLDSEKELQISQDRWLGLADAVLGPVEERRIVFEADNIVPKTRRTAKKKVS